MSTFIHIKSSGDQFLLLSPDRNNDDTINRIEQGGHLLWANQGLVGLIKNPILQDVLRVYRAHYPAEYDLHRNLERDVPPDVGRVYWSQVQLHGTE